VPRRTSTAARVLAPVAFLAAITILVLLVRSALDSGEPVAATEPALTATAPAATEAEPETQPATEPVTEAPPATQTETAPPADAQYYEIQSGDTLESIAQRHGTTVERLLELNPGIDPVALTVGERIRVA